jgi:hypothetical protein
MLLDEFDAIIAAEWPAEQLTRPRGEVRQHLFRPKYGPHGSSPRWVSRLPTEGPCGENGDGPGRQRSPPLW